MARYHLFFIIIILTLLSGCVSTQQTAILENKVAALETEYKKKLRIQTAKNYAMDNNLRILAEKINKSSLAEEYAEIKHDINILKENNQQLRGVIEEINHSFQTQSGSKQLSSDERIKKFENNVYQNYLRLLKLENYLGMRGSGQENSVSDINPVPDKSGGDEQEKQGSKATEQTDSEKALYAVAKKLFDEGDYDKAKAQFDNFLKQYPDSQLAANAMFWLAESYYARQWYEKAILEYQKVLENYPQSNKAQGAKLKQGYAFAELGEKANARFILNELIKHYPDSDEAKLARKKSETIQGN